MSSFTVYRLQCDVCGEICDLKKIGQRMINIHHDVDTFEEYPERWQKGFRGYGDVCPDCVKEINTALADVQERRKERMFGK